MKMSKINKADRCAAAHNGLVAGSSAVRTKNEINRWSEPCCGRGGLWPQVSAKCFHRQSGCVHRPSAKKFDNQNPKAAYFLFVRRGTQSHDELIATVPLRPRLGMMLGMINTSDIFSIVENASACTSSRRRVT
jgi:hypothetical protein